MLAPEGIWVWAWAQECREHALRGGQGRTTEVDLDKLLAHFGGDVTKAQAFLDEVAPE